MSNPPPSNPNPTLSPSLSPRASTSTPSANNGQESNENLDSIRAEYSQLGVSPRLPNIPLRNASGVTSPSSNQTNPSTPANLPDPDSDDLNLGLSVTNTTRQQRGTGDESNNSSNRVSMTDSELGKAVENDDNMDLDTLPISDEQKARIIARQSVYIHKCREQTRKR